MIKHEIERKQETLRVVVELDLGEALAYLGPRQSLYEERVRDYLAQLPAEIIDVLVKLNQDPELGVVKWFDESKGYGYIRAHDQTDVFVHWHGIRGEGFRTLGGGQQVRFRRRMGQRSEEAIDVEPVVAKPEE